MGHLIRHVLTTSHPLWVDTDLDQEQLNPSQKVSESLVIDDFL